MHCSQGLLVALTIRSCFSSQSKCFRFRRDTEKLVDTHKKNKVRDGRRPNLQLLLHRAFTPPPNISLRNSQAQLTEETEQSPKQRNPTCPSPAIPPTGGCPAPEQNPQRSPLVLLTCVALYEEHVCLPVLPLHVLHLQTEEGLMASSLTSLPRGSTCSPATSPTSQHPMQHFCYHTKDLFTQKAAVELVIQELRRNPLLQQKQTLPNHIYFTCALFCAAFLLSLVSLQFLI